MKKFIALFVLAACGGGSDPKNPTDVKPATGAPAITQFTKRDDALKVDKIGGSDGSLKPDGKPDAAFDAVIRGPIVGLLVHSPNDTSWQWDTYTGQATIPAKMKALVPKGHMTGGIGVFEKDQPLNNPDGSFALTDDKDHHVVIYIADNGAFQPGATFQLAAETPDHDIIESPVAKF